MLSEIKPVLRHMIDNNTPHWRPETIRGAHKQLDGYEAKAKAFDCIENLVRTELTSDDLYNDARNNDYVAGMLRVYETVDYIIEEYERGDSE